MKLFNGAITLRDIENMSRKELAERIDARVRNNKEEERQQKEAAKKMQHK